MDVYVHIIHEVKLSHCFIEHSKYPSIQVYIAAYSIGNIYGRREDEVRCEDLCCCSPFKFISIVMSYHIST